MNSDIGKILNPEDPKIGDTKLVQLPSGRLIECIWLACTNCGYKRWVRAIITKPKTYTGLCQACAHHRNAVRYKEVVEGGRWRIK